LAINCEGLICKKRKGIHPGGLNSKVRWIFISSDESKNREDSDKRILLSARDSIGGAGKESPSDRVSSAGRLK